MIEDITRQAIEMVKAFSADSAQQLVYMDLFPVGVAIIDRQGKIVFYSQAQSKIDGLEKEEVLGRPRKQVLEPVNHPGLLDICLKTGQPVLGHPNTYRTFKGRLVEATAWVFPIFKDEEFLGIIRITLPLSYKLEANPPKAKAVTAPVSKTNQGRDDKIVGVSPAFQKCVLVVKSNAPNPFPILISGETGSGKEMLAKLVHRQSPRKDKPFMALNCSAVPAPLLEGLLFGTVKGSFTGAVDRPGFMEQVNGGTLYLDEIDSMPFELQPKLLRAIQDMRISRVGSTREIALDIKLVSSIGCTPQKALKAGTLRPDLFYRLAVVVVNIPPLRQRPEDLESLAEFFMLKYARILNKEAFKLDPRLWSLMRKYSWPGNVRELEHMLAGAMAMVKGDGVIGLEHLPEHFIQTLGRADDEMPGSPDGEDPFFPDRPAGLEGSLLCPRSYPDLDPVKKLDREIEDMKECLRQSGGNITKAARQLGLSRQSLSYRLMKYGLDYRAFRRK